ncbi:MAG: PQQ-binding-like beta-propeller repeat protein [Bryobacteraceae bacterium]
MRLSVACLCLCLFISRPLVSSPSKRGSSPERPPKAGVTTPGVQIALPSLKNEAEVSLSGTADAVAFSGSIYVASKSGNVVIPVDAKTNKPDTPIFGFHAPCAIVNAFSSLWVQNCGNQTLSRLDGKTKKTTATIPVTIAASQSGYVASADSLWILVDDKTTLARLDPDENKLVSETRLPAGCNSIHFAEAALWVTCPTEQSVLRIDPQTGLQTNKIDVTGKPIAATSGESAIWVLSQLGGKVSKLDPKTNKVTATIELNLPTPAASISFGDGSVWVGAPGFPITRIDPAADKVVQQFVGEGGGPIYLGLNSLWLTNNGPNAVRRFDPKRIKSTLAE